mgnify:CR=1 FL=1
MKNQYGQRDSLEKQAKDLAEQLEELKEKKIDEDQNKNTLNKENLELNRQIAETQTKQVCILFLIIFWCINSIN